MKYLYIEKNKLMVPSNINLNKHILDAYQSAIGPIISSLSHSLVTANSHYCVNEDYKIELKFLAGWYIEKSHKLVLSILYVDSKYRGQGHAKNILNILQNSWTNGFIQLSVKCESPQYVKDLYLKMHFKSDAEFGIKRPNPQYIDFFWSKRKISVSWHPIQGYTITPI